MNSKVILTVAIIGALLFVLFFVRLRGRIWPTTGVPGPSHSEAQAEPRDTLRSSERMGLVTLDEQLHDGGHVAATDPSREADRIIVHGEVVDASGNRLEGVGLTLMSNLEGGTIAWSDAGGQFMAVLEKTPDLVLADGQGYATLMAASVETNPQADLHRVVVSSAVSVRGIVHDQQGPIASCAVEVRLPSVALAHFPYPTTGTSVWQYQEWSKSDGTFFFGAVPAMPGTTLVVNRTGYEAYSQQIQLDETYTHIFLKRLPISVVGVVLHKQGNPANGALVLLAGAKTRTQPDGSFSLPVELPIPRSAPLVASLVGYIPAFVEDFGGILLDSSSVEPMSINLSLGDEAISISGSVATDGTEPCIGWRVRLVDGTVLNEGQYPPVVLEGLGQQPGYQQTDKNGAFTIGNLGQREYRVQTWDPKTLVCVQTGPIRAGTQGVLVVVPRAAMRTNVPGTVVSKKGSPIPKARVTISLLTTPLPGMPLGGMSEQGESVTTDDRGRFTISVLPRQFVQLNVTGDGVIPTAFTIESLRTGQGELRLETPARCYVQVTNSPVQAATSFVLVDGTGAPVGFWKFAANDWQGFSRAELVDGKSEVFAVSEEAQMLVLYTRGKEVLRRIIQLTPGIVTTIEP